MIKRERMAWKEEYYSGDQLKQRTCDPFLWETDMGCPDARLAHPTPWTIWGHIFPWPQFFPWWLRGLALSILNCSTLPWFCDWTHTVSARNSHLSTTFPVHQFIDLILIPLDHTPDQVIIKGRSAPKKTPPHIFPLSTWKCAKKIGNASYLYCQ